MNSLDRNLKRERKQKYKRLKKLIKARDMASKYLSNPIRVSQLLKHFSFSREDSYLFTSDLAHRIVKQESLIRGIRPPKPVSLRK